MDILEVGVMPKTVIDIDEEALARAAELLGTATKKDTVNAALRDVVARHARAAAVADFMTDLDSGLYADLLDPEVMGQAWR
ncbi:type II toxin-antitoxin system VapB family antitoxin [Kitasatospora kifunensis]|uniref:Arc/MetJ family transcription regulator n=1 Tax=Kitasatospora kifunensis TaxID=58351 RepID=A0A7W7VXA6_KITKI|nr:Arc/MetJ family transcription regulator [Kitasatospora kifunensis]